MSVTDWQPLTFLYPGWLWLLPVCALLLGYCNRRGSRRSIWETQIDANFYALLRPVAAARNDAGRRTLLPGLLLTLCVLAMAGPSCYKQRYPLLESAAARVLVVDLSRSMRVRDVSTDRHQLARQLAITLTAGSFAGETGLVVFAGASFTVAPLTRDSNTLIRFLDALTPATMPIDGDRIDLGIERATALLRESIAGHGDILIITDGTDNPMAAVDAAKFAHQQGNRVSLFAVGTPTGGPIPDHQGGLLRERNGQIVLSRTRTEPLAVIASAGGGRLLPLRSAAAIDRSVAALQQRTEPDLRDTNDSPSSAIDGGFWLVWCALPVLLLLFRRHAGPLLVVLVPLLPYDSAHALELQSLWRNAEQRAHQAFIDGDYQRAQQLSKRALLQGTAAFHLGNFDAAIELLAADDSAMAHYNRGNALVAQQRLDDAINAYQSALAIDPNHADANQNLLLVMRFLDQQTVRGGDTSDSDPASQQDELDSDDESSEPARSGQDSESSDRPVDGEQPGLGAGMAQGRMAAEDNFEGLDIVLERLLTRLQSDATVADRQLLEHWADRLRRADPGEFFTRKFLRDHQRNSNQPR